MGNRRLHTSQLQEPRAAHSMVCRMQNGALKGNNSPEGPFPSDPLSLASSYLKVSKIFQNSSIAVDQNLNVYTWEGHFIQTHHYVEDFMGL